MKLNMKDIKIRGFKEQNCIFEDMLIEDDYEIIKFFIEINEDKRQEHIKQTKENPLMRWKVQVWKCIINRNVFRRYTSIY